MAKKKKKKTKWPGLKYEVLVPETRPAYQPNPTQESPLELLDSIVIKEKDPRQSPDLPKESIYAICIDDIAEPEDAVMCVAETPQVKVIPIDYQDSEEEDEEGELKNSEAEGPSPTAVLEPNVETAKEKITPEKKSQRTVTLIPVSTPVVADTKQDRIEQAQDVTPKEQEGQGKKDEIMEEQVEKKGKGQQKDDTPDKGPLKGKTFSKEKVDNWIESSQQYFVPSPQGNGSELELGEIVDSPDVPERDPTPPPPPAPIKLVSYEVEDNQQHIMAESQKPKTLQGKEEIVKSVTSDIVKTALKGFAQEEESLFKARTVSVSSHKSNKTEASEISSKSVTKTIQIGKLSSKTQELANNSDAVEAVFSALHKTNDEVVSTLRKEVKKTGPVSPRKDKATPLFPAYTSNYGRKEQKSMNEKTLPIKIGIKSPEPLAPMKSPEPYKRTSKSRWDSDKDEEGGSENQQSQCNDTQSQPLNAPIKGEENQPKDDAAWDDMDKEEQAALVEYADSILAEEQEEQYQSHQRDRHSRKRKRKRRSEGTSRRSRIKHRRYANQGKFSATHEPLNGISEFTYTLAKGLEKDTFRKAFDRLMKHKRKGMTKCLNTLCKGQTFNFSDVRLDENFSHFSGLSLGTQLECTFTPESSVVKRAHYDVLKDWLSQKPLDSYVVGNYDVSNLHVEEIRPSLQIEETVRDCYSDFNESVFEMLRGEKVPVEQSNVFPKPRNDTEETVDKVFRQVHQYMDFVVSQAKNSSKGGMLNGYSTGPENAVDNGASGDEPYDPERPGSPLSSIGSGLSDDEPTRKSKSKHKRKKKKRKHKKSSKSPDKRQKEHHDYLASDEEEDESDNSEPPSTRQKLEEGVPEKENEKEKVKDCYKPSSAPAKKKNTTGAPPKGIDGHGMSHIMDEFYGDVESMMNNNSDVSLDAPPTSDQHLPPLQGPVTENLVKDKEMDTVIDEEMTKTKLDLLNIVPTETASKKETTPTLTSARKKTFEYLFSAYSKATTEKATQGSTSATSDSPEKTESVEVTEISRDPKVRAVSQKNASKKDDITRPSEPKPTVTNTQNKVQSSPASMVPRSVSVAEKSQPKPSYQRTERKITVHIDVSTGKTAEKTTGIVLAGDRPLPVVDENNTVKGDRQGIPQTPDQQVSQNTSPSHRKSNKRKVSLLHQDPSDNAYFLKKQRTPESGPQTTAPFANATYVDSFTSKLADPFGKIPVSNIEGLFDVTNAPPQGRYSNPYSYWWNIVQYFIDQSRTDCDTKYLETWLPEWNNCFVSDVLPENSFLLALSFASGKVLREYVDKKVATDDALEFSDVSDDINEYGSAFGTHLERAFTRQRTLSSNSTGSTTEYASTGEGANAESAAKAAAAAAKKSGKKVNTLALAFRQAVEAKKQAQNGRPSVPVTIVKIKPIQIRTRKKSESKSDTTSKAPDENSLKGVNVVPYGENTSGDGTKRVPLSTYFEPQLNTRIHSVMEEAMHDFVGNLTNTVKDSLGQQKWNTVELPSTFYKPPNQLRHLAGLSRQSKTMYKVLSNGSLPRWMCKKVNAEVQTDRSRIPKKLPLVEKSSPIVEIKEVASAKEVENTTLIVPPCKRQEATAQSLSVQQVATEKIQLLAVNSLAQATTNKTIQEEPTVSTVTSVDEAVNTTNPPEKISDELQLQTSTTELRVAKSDSAPVPLVPTMAPVTTAQSSPTPASATTAAASISKVPVLTQTPLEVRNFTAVQVAPVAQLSSLITESKTTAVTSTTTTAAIGAATEPQSMLTPSIMTENLPTVPAPVTKPLRIMPTVKFSFSKPTLSLSHKPAAFAPIATTTVRLPFVELPPLTVTASNEPTTVTTKSTPNSSGIPVTTKQPTTTAISEPVQCTSSAGLTGAVTSDSVATVGETSVIRTTISSVTLSTTAGNAAGSSTQTISSTSTVEPEKKEEPASEAGSLSFLNTPLYSFVSMEPVEIPGLGDYDESATIQKPGDSAKPAPDKAKAAECSEGPVAVTEAASISVSTPASVVSTPVTQVSMATVPVTTAVLALSTPHPAVSLSTSTASPLSKPISTQVGPVSTPVAQVSTPAVQVANINAPVSTLTSPATAVIAPVSTHNPSRSSGFTSMFFPVAPISAPPSEMFPTVTPVSTPTTSNVQEAISKLPPAIATILSKATISAAPKLNLSTESAAGTTLTTSQDNIPALPTSLPPMDIAGTSRSTPSPPGIERTTPPAPGTTDAAFTLDAIPLPPGGKTISPRWQEWKKQQELRKQVEAAKEAGELKQWPLENSNWRKKVEPAPPVSSLTEWPLRSATQPLKPPPMPPLAQNKWGASPDPNQQHGNPQQYNQDWYGYNQQWQGGWGTPPRGPPQQHDWGGWHSGAGHWRGWAPPRHHGPRWDQHWDQSQQQWGHQQGWGDQSQQQWGDPNMQQQDWSQYYANWNQQPWDPTQATPGGQQEQQPYTEPEPGPPGHDESPPPLPPGEPPAEPPGQGHAQWQTQAPEPQLPPTGPPGADATQPVILGHAGNPGGQLPARNVRMFVFNVDQPICKSVASFLTFLGAKTFDPYNVVALQALQPGVEVVVLIHVEDVGKLHEVPNLQALKSQEWVKFATYENVTDVRNKTYTLILKSGGIAVPDDSIILSLQPETLEAICNYMLRQRQTEGGEPWYLLIHNHILNKLLNVREDERMRRLCLILTRYEEAGVVRVLRSPSFDNTPQPPHEYLSLMLRLQAEYAHSMRHTVLLTDLPQTDERSLPFQRQGISLMNISSFIRAIVGANPLPPIPQAMPYYGRKTDEQFMDSYHSSAEDLLPPMVITDLVDESNQHSNG